MNVSSAGSEKKLILNAKHVNVSMAGVHESSILNAEGRSYTVESTIRRRERCLHVLVTSAVMEALSDPTACGPEGHRHDG